MQDLLRLKNLIKDIKEDKKLEEGDKIEIIKRMEEIDKKFTGAIKKQTYWIATERHKERWLPEMEFK